jgi:hypothetical protein
MIVMQKSTGMCYDSVSRMKTVRGRDWSECCPSPTQDLQLQCQSSPAFNAGSNGLLRRSAKLADPRQGAITKERAHVGRTCTHTHTHGL